MASKVNRVLLHFKDSAALRLLTAEGLRWHGKRGPTSQDPAWKELRKQSFVRQDQLLRDLAAELKIPFRPRTRAFWMALSLCLLDLFPAHRIDRESRGRSAGRQISPSLFEEISRIGGKQSAAVHQIATREGIPAVTLERRYREWKRAMIKGGKNL